MFAKLRAEKENVIKNLGTTYLPLRMTCPWHVINLTLNGPISLLSTWHIFAAYGKIASADQGLFG